MKNIESGITRHVTDRSNFIDIGSGDGRITLLGADYFEKSQGIEINRWLVYYSALKGEILRVVRTQAIFEINVGKSRIRYTTTLKLNDEFLDRLKSVEN